MSTKWRKVDRKPAQDDATYLPYQSDVEFQLENSPQVKEPFIKRMWECISTRALVIIYWIMNPLELYQTLMYSVMDTSYILLFVLFAINYYLLILFVCMVIYLIALYEKRCIKVGDGSLEDFTSGGQIFSGLFALSWTTVSTVGYGNTWPALSKDDEDEVINCPVVNILLMAAAFFGVCFAGACGAILLGKVVQVKTQAQIEFSQAMVVRYGSGLMDISDNDDEVEGDAKKSTAPKEGMPCPVLEFRLANKLHNVPTGVIMDATLSCAVGVHEYDLQDGDENNYFYARLVLPESSSRSIRRPDKVKRISLPKKIFLDLNIVNSVHPHFKRCWTAMHILDDNSPLLSPKMRSRIKKNSGLWPMQKDKYRTPRYIKDNIIFEEIIVSFNGVSKHVSAEVNAQKVYNSCDIVIGYQFVPILEKHGDEVKVLMDCLNDVAFQNGGDEALPIEDGTNKVTR